MNQIIVPQPQEIDNFQKGLEFEDFIICLFDKHKFELLHWRSDKVASNGAYPYSNTLPDLEFQHKDKYRQRFAIECKWRKGFENGEVRWAERYQINNYQRYQAENRITVYVAIGIGGSPNNPQRLYITPLDEIARYPILFESYLYRFEKRPCRSLNHDVEQLVIFEEGY